MADPPARDAVLLILSGGRKKRNKLKAIPATMSGWRGTCLPAPAGPAPPRLKALRSYDFYQD